MKKVILITIIVFASHLVQSQNSLYKLGFNTGFWDGYCYDKTPCIKPHFPKCPIPIRNEESYLEAYYRGHKIGKHIN